MKIEDMSETRNITDAVDNSAGLPLVVNLDGTLTPTFTINEIIVQLIRRSPFSILRLPFWLFKDRSEFKALLAARVTFDAEHLPYSGPLLAYLREQKNKGRQIVLATDTHDSVAQGVADHLRLFDHVLSTSGATDRTCQTRLKDIRRTVGNKFVYVGSSRHDLPIWREARAAVLVGTPARMSTIVRTACSIEREFPSPPVDISTWLRALRVHQWVKNILLFVPLLTAFSFTAIGNIIALATAFFAFSLSASATYILNDLWDLRSDRVHPRKRFRPFASGALGIRAGVIASAVLMVCGGILAWNVSDPFLAMLATYVALTSAYSWALKQYVVLDALALSSLYTLRIIAGSVAIGVAVSAWLLAFSAFLFLSLAFVKRCAELVSLCANGLDATHGRDYQVSDLNVLWPLGVGSSLSAVVIFGLFINAPETRAQYMAPQLLWLVSAGLVYWTTRLWIKTSRGEMHDDPVIYAIRDPGSRAIGLTMIIVVIAARFLSIPVYL